MLPNFRTRGRKGDNDNNNQQQDDIKNGKFKMKETLTQVGDIFFLSSPISDRLLRRLHSHLNAFVQENSVDSLNRGRLRAIENGGALKLDMGSVFDLGVLVNEEGLGEPDGVGGVN